VADHAGHECDQPGQSRIRPGRRVSGAEGADPTAAAQSAAARSPMPAGGGTRSSDPTAYGRTAGKEAGGRAGRGGGQPGVEEQWPGRTYRVVRQYGGADGPE